MRHLAIFGFASALCAQALPPLPNGYDQALWERACRLHFAAVVVDTHSDTTSRILDEGFDMGAKALTGHMDLPRIAEGGLDVQFYSIYVAAQYYGAEDLKSDKALAASKANASARRALQMIDGIQGQIAKHHERMQGCASVTEISAALAKGKHAALMGIEGGHAIEGDLRLLRQFYRMGVRYMTLTHTNSNEFADSCAEATPKWNGLNDLGRDVVAEMNRVGMMVDVSHVSDKTFFDVIAIAKAPVIFSHSSCRALCGHKRNATDAMLQALAKNGGVIMINYNSGFLDDDFSKRYEAYRAPIKIREKAIAAKHGEGTEAYKSAVTALEKAHTPPEPPPLAKLLDHFMHAIEIAGAEHVGMGSDFDGIPSTPRGLEDVTCLPKITYGLLERGVSEADVKKVLGENLLRVFAAVEKTARELQAK